MSRADNNVQSVEESPVKASVTQENVSNNFDKSAVRYEDGKCFYKGLY